VHNGTSRLFFRKLQVGANSSVSSVFLHLVPHTVHLIYLDLSQKDLEEAYFAKNITQEMFNLQITRMLVADSLPDNIVESIEFRRALLMGRDRAHLKLHGRTTQATRRRAFYEAVLPELKKLFAGMTPDGRRRSRPSVTFDLWTDKLGTCFIAITGHVFREGKLISALLAMEHMPKDDEGHTGARIGQVVRAALAKVLVCTEEEVKKTVFCGVTDGAGNVRAACVALVGRKRARRCLQHGLQLVLKYLCGGNRRIASALAACGYMSRLSKVSTAFSGLLGAYHVPPVPSKKLPGGIATRWGYYVKCAEEVYAAMSGIVAWSAQGQTTSAFQNAYQQLFHVDARTGATGMQVSLPPPFSRLR
jgi:hypothetical protein